MNSTQGIQFAQKNFDKTVSDQCIRNILHRNEMKTYRRQKTPALNSKHKIAWKNFYLAHKNKTFDEFKNYVFSDESSFGLEGGSIYYKTTLARAPKKVSFELRSLVARN